MGIRVNRSGTGTLTIRKTADEVVNNSTTQQDDDHLFFSIGANETWTAEWVIFATAANSSPDLDIAITMPASPTLCIYSVHGARAIDTVVTAFTTATAAGTEIGPIGLTAATINHFRIVGHFTNGTTAGSVKLQWAQSVAGASDTTVKAGSFVTPRRVA